MNYNLLGNQNLYVHVYTKEEGKVSAYLHKKKENDRIDKWSFGASFIISRVHSNI